MKPHLSEQSSIRRVLRDTDLLPVIQRDSAEIRREFNRLCNSLPVWTTTSTTTQRTVVASTVPLTTLAHAVCTLLSDLQNKGILG